MSNFIRRNTRNDGSVQLPTTITTGTGAFTTITATTGTITTVNATTATITTLGSTTATFTNLTSTGSTIINDSSLTIRNTATNSKHILFDASGLDALTTLTLATASGGSSVITLPANTTDTVLVAASAQVITNKYIDNSCNFVNATNDRIFKFNSSNLGFGFTYTISGLATANRTITLPDITDTAVVLTAVQTLTNKTLTSPTISAILNSTNTFNFPNPGGITTFADQDTTQTLLHKTLTSPTLTSPTFSGTVAGTPSYSGLNTFSAGIQLGSSNQTTLSDYEETTMTGVTFSCGSGGAGAASSAVVIQLTRNGRMVTALVPSFSLTVGSTPASFMGASANVPARFAPNLDGVVGLCRVTNNGTNAFGMSYVSSNQIQFFYSAALANFTASQVSALNNNTYCHWSV